GVSRVADDPDHLTDRVVAVEKAAGECFIDDGDSRSDRGGFFDGREFATFQKSESQRHEVVGADRAKGARPRGLMSLGADALEQTPVLRITEGNARRQRCCRDTRLRSSAREQLAIHRRALFCVEAGELGVDARQYESVVLISGPARGGSQSRAREDSAGSEQ